MLLKNHTADQYIGVDVNGKSKQVWPGQIIEVPDTTGKGLLANYSYIFMKVETDGDKLSLLQKEKDGLLNELALAQGIIQTQSLQIVELEKTIQELKDQNELLGKEVIWVRTKKAEKKVEEVKEEEKEEEKTDEIEGKEEEANDDRLEKALEEYETLKWGKAPNNKKNDLDWLLGKIEEMKKWE